MNGKAVVLRDVPFEHLKNESFEVAILPWGATEAHNTHLPYGTDILESESIAASSARHAAAQGARILVLPAIPFGVNTGQLDIPFTINMNPSTQFSVLKDVVASLGYHKVKKLVVLNSHGGNDFKQMIRELQPATSIFLCAVNWYKALNLNDYFEKPGDHADEMETSVMLHLFPHLVLPLSYAGTGKEHTLRIQAFKDGWAWTPRQWTKATSDTGVGDPHAASAEKGARFLDAVNAKVGLFLTALAKTSIDQMYEE